MGAYSDHIKAEVCGGVGATPRTARCLRRAKAHPGPLDGEALANHERVFMIIPRLCLPLRRNWYEVFQNLEELESAITRLKDAFASLSAEQKDFVAAMSPDSEKTNHPISQEPCNAFVIASVLLPFWGHSFRLSEH